MAFGGYVCSRNTLIFLNVLYFIVATLLISLAAYAKVLSIIMFPAMSAMIACGVLLAIIAVAGIIGAIKHHQVILFFYMVILFLIFLLQFSVACVSLALTDEQQREIFIVGWKISSPELKLKTQKIFHCCGMNRMNQEIGEENKIYNHPSCVELFPLCRIRNITARCCQEYTPPTEHVILAYNLTTISPRSPSYPFSPTSISKPSTCPVVDCWSVIESQLHQLVRAIGSICLFISFTELIGIWLTFRFRNQKDPKANPSAFL